MGAAAAAAGGGSGCDAAAAAAAAAAASPSPSSAATAAHANPSDTRTCVRVIRGFRCRRYPVTFSSPIVSRSRAYASTRSILRSDAARYSTTSATSGTRAFAKASTSRGHCGVAIARRQRERKRVKDAERGCDGRDADSVMFCRRSLELAPLPQRAPCPGLANVPSSQCSPSSQRTHSLFIDHSGRLAVDSPEPSPSHSDFTSREDQPPAHVRSPAWAEMGGASRHQG